MTFAFFFILTSEQLEKVIENVLFQLLAHYMFTDIHKQTYKLGFERKLSDYCVHLPKRVLFLRIEFNFWKGLHLNNFTRDLKYS